MGFNTNITICNDYLADYENQPEVFTGIICRSARLQEGDRQWGITVLPSAHADATQLIAAGGNFASKLHTVYNMHSHHTREGQIAVLEQWAKALGFSLVRDSEK
ncbi:hypothetical protein [Mycobacteroides abscessus]|uniref:hypothetical protein n=1 Tax=Mycobacteroides abscessus TaxID=36809 RepID=UPI000C26B504|nr:hypothetical protein [Mycobacteroides abscessus]